MKRQFICVFLAAMMIIIGISVPVAEVSGQEEVITLTSGPLRFEERLVFGDGIYMYGIGASDLDADGDLDLTSADTRTQELLWYENDGRGNLTTRMIAGKDLGHIERHATGDINGDGHLDLVIVKNWIGHLVWFENSGTPRDGKHWRQHVITTSFMRAYDVALVDLDDDGDLDVAASAFRGDCFAWFENPGPAGLSRQWKQYVFDKNIANTRTVLTTDINRDGKVDLLGTATFDNLTIWYENTGQPGEKLFRRHVIDDQVLQPTHGQPVDMDDDGDPDVLMASGMRVDAKEKNSHQVAWYENVGSPGVGSQWKKHIIGKLIYGYEAVSGDLDGDGDLDVIATGCQGLSGAGKVCWFENTGDPKGSWKKHHIKDYPLVAQVIVMDLDKDGRLDIAASSEKGTFYWWKNLGRASSGAASGQPQSKDVLDIGSRRELFVDDYLIDTMQGVQQVLQKPVRREVVMNYDRPWEGNTCIYPTVFQDGDIYRMYYRASNYDEDNPPTTAFQNRKPRLICYAQSTDGIHWTRPMLGMTEVDGSTQNNVVWPPTDQLMADGSINGSSSFMAFKDENPACLAKERYKGTARFHTPDKSGRRIQGLALLVSPDGIHWSVKKHQVIIDGEFDALNRLFWDSFRQQYVAFYRDAAYGFPGGGYRGKDGYRAIKTAVSPDALNWTPGTLLDYGDAPPQELYDPAILAYHRAPHIFVGFPLRYVTGRGKLGSTHRVGKLWSQLSDVLLMTSRDGYQWRQWREAFLRPGPQCGNPEHYRWGGHVNNMASGSILETKSDTPGAPNELSIYSIEGYYSGKSSQLRRFTLRLDGFVALHASADEGQMVTRPFIFKGSRLSMNFSTSAAGSVRVEIQDARGQPLAGFTLAQSPEMYGDEIDRVVTWKGGSDVGSLAGKPVRLRFVMKDADLYSIRFQP